MKIRYVVHSISAASFPVKAIVAGEEIEAQIPGVVAELVSEDGSMGHTFKFADSKEFDTDQLKVGSVVVAEFTVETPAKRAGK